MKILAIYKYYWPDTTPYARILKGILEHWVENGHEVSVLTAQPGYNDLRHPPQPRSENLNGVEVHRLRTPREVKNSPARRVLSFLVFLGQAVIKASTGPGYDFVIVNPHPPILMGLAVRLIRFLRGIPYVYHCEDIHPESALAAGKMKDGRRAGLLRRIDTDNCKMAGLIVTLSSDMVGTLEDRGLNRQGIRIINNYILGDGEDAPAGPSALEAVFGNTNDDFILLFAGNLGLYQGLDHFIHTAEILADRPDIKFLFMGEGAAKAGLLSKSGALLDKTVFFCPFQPLAIAKQAMGEADLSLVSLAPGVFRVAYPSKTMNCLSAGSPLLAIIENESCLAREIRDNDLGYCCPQGDYRRTAEAILDACENRRKWRAARPRIAAWADQNFGREKILDSWTRIPAHFPQEKGQK
jgi:glycosyltransferase involved in cell wall biosynthesis